MSFVSLPAGAWLAIGVIAAIRIIALRRRGVRAVVIDPLRSAAEQAFEAATLALLVFWIYLVVDYADGRGPTRLPAWADHVLIDELPLKLSGAALLVASVVLYSLATKAMGDSWRMGIDRTAQATLITRGVFARSRNPIYLAFDLNFIGGLLIHGRAVLLLSALALILVFHIQIHREERFLAAAYGDRFIDYCGRVRRYI